MEGVDSMVPGAVPSPVGMGIDMEPEPELPAQRDSPAETAFSASSGEHCSLRQSWLCFLMVSWFSGLQ